jgi:hypothetical protein
VNPRVCLRAAAAVTAATLSLSITPVIIQDSASAVPRVGSSKSRESSPSRNRATPPTSVEPRSPGSPVWIAKWSGTSSLVSFRVLSDSKVSIFDIGRDKNHQPKGTAGQMIADSLRAANIPQPKIIKIDMISNPPTVAKLAQGKSPSETVLGETVRKTVEDLGGEIAEWVPVPPGVTDAFEVKVTY